MYAERKSGVMNNWKWYQRVLFPVSVFLFSVLMPLSLVMGVLMRILEVSAFEGKKLTKGLREWI